MNPGLSYLRWRHSKGFGVHSPFAYRFVTDVIRLKRIYSFYSYEDIDRNLEKEELTKYKFIRLVRFVIRLAVFLKTKRIVIASCSSSTLRDDSTPITEKKDEDKPERTGEVAAKALNIPFFKVKDIDSFNFREGDLLLIGKLFNSPELIHKSIHTHTPVLALNPSGDIRHLLETPIDQGVLFNGKKMMVLIPRCEMEYVSYHMAFNV